MLRAGMPPVVPLVSVAAGPIGFLLTLVLVIMTKADEGAHVLPPLLLTVVGVVWLGWHLRRETAADATHSGRAIA